MSPRQLPSQSQLSALASLVEQQRFSEAERAARTLTTNYPSFGPGWKILGLALRSLGKSKAALQAYKRAVDLVSSDIDARCQLAQLYSELRQWQNAENNYKEALRIRPDAIDTHCQLGNMYYDQGKLEAAADCYRNALALDPDYAMGYSNLGHILGDLKHLDKAEDAYRKALHLMPSSAEIWCDLGVILQELDRSTEAESCYRNALALKPDYADAHYNLGVALNAQQRTDEAKRSYNDALRLSPQHASALVNLGMIHYEASAYAEAEACYRRALESKPNDIEALCNLGILLHNTGRSMLAEQCYIRALRIKPDCAAALYDLGVIQFALGRPEDTVSNYRKAIAIRSDSINANCNLLFTLAYSQLVSPSSYLSEARNWEIRVIPEAQRQAAASRTFSTLPRQKRRLKVGYVSGDFNAHAVSYFIEPILRLHDRSRVEITAYSNSKKQDSTTRQLMPLADRWEDIHTLDDLALLDKIAADGIDVLVDLSGYTDKNRLGVFARRAAPVQLHYLGFYASTGLTEMDYWIGDSVLLPESEDSHFCERIWRLPRIWVSYQGNNEAPQPCWNPASDGTIWLGSFNNLGKITPETLALWAKLLKALPNAKLLLKTKELSQKSNQDRIEKIMNSLGVSSNRIELIGGTPDWASHMALYDRLDIALDPIGAVGGGTTSCDALWMGVPTVTLVGQTMGQRMTASMLSALGLQEWMTGTEADYIAKVIDLAHQTDYRKKLRLSLRDTMRNSPLCDSAGLAAALEDAYEAMFDRWWTRHPHDRHL